MSIRVGLMQRGEHLRSFKLFSECEEHLDNLCKGELPEELRNSGTKLPLTVFRVGKDILCMWSQVYPLRLQPQYPAVLLEEAARP